MPLRHAAYSFTISTPDRASAEERFHVPTGDRISTIETLCPHCRKTMQAPSEYVGRQTKCVACGTRFTIQHSSSRAVFKTAAAQHSETAQNDLPASPGERTRPAVSVAQAYVVIALLLILVGASLFTNFRPLTQWEYTIESPLDSSLERELGKLGEQGWELVVARRATTSYGSASYEMIFKRPR